MKQAPTTGATSVASARRLSRRRAAASLEAVSERELMSRYQRCGDLRAREALVRRFMPMARELARRYAYTREPIDDLTQVAYVGLLSAIDRFDPARGFRFTSFAVPTILGELKRHLRDRGWAVHLPRDLKERVVALNSATATVAKQLGRSPSTRRMAEELGWEPEEVLEAQAAADSYEATSLDVSVDRHDRGAATRLIDTLGAEDSAYDLFESREAIASAWRELPNQEQRVLALRFTGELTQSEIGERIGISQMHVSRLLRRALARLEQAA